MVRHGTGLVIDAHVETYAVAWCPVNHCGGVYALSKNRWTLTTPIAFAEFLALLDTEGILPPAARDWQARRWIKACALAGRDAPLNVDQLEEP